MCDALSCIECLNPVKLYSDLPIANGHLIRSLLTFFIHHSFLPRILRKFFCTSIFFCLLCNWTWLGQYRKKQTEFFGGNIIEKVAMWIKELTNHTMKIKLTSIKMPQPSSNWSYVSMKYITLHYVACFCWHVCLKFMLILNTNKLDEK